MKIRRLFCVRLKGNRDVHERFIKANTIVQFLAPEGRILEKMEGKKIQEVQLVGDEQYRSIRGVGIFEMDDERLIIPFRGGYIEILANEINVLR